jgi:undecaprenyl diphosphate synthase
MGATRLVDLLDVLLDDGIQYCTLYGFSTENWSRPPEEIREIFRVIEQTARSLAGRVLNEASRIQIRFVGDLQDERIPDGLKNILEELQEAPAKKWQTNNNNDASRTLTVCLAINDGDVSILF